MTKSGKEHEGEAADRPALDPARVSDFSEAMKLNPLMANMAAATAISFGIASQMAGAFFGALQGAMEAGNRQKAAGEAPSAEVPAEASMATETPAPAQAPVAAAVAAEPVPAAEKPKPKAAAPAPKAAVTATKTKPATKPAVKAKVATAKTVPPKAPAKPAVEARAVKASKAKVTKAKALGGGDLKQISGIGPKLVEVLNGLGVTNLAQVAAWGEADIARFDSELGLNGRIGRDDWVGQAKALLK
ncbi:5' DNA nuclease [Neorhizobium sp. LjRoot104]|uniref:5' DNA nuclease n=1 Tax=Neorhizobium sp. LjRoot104 TaxID=3342254 RepID=UPI003ECFC574